MDLILWRHAQAHVGPPGWVADEANALRIAQGERPTLSHAQDLARGLTPKGERQAERMAAWLNQRLPASTRVLASPAQRTRQTAQALGRDFKVLHALDPQGDAGALLQAVRWPRARDPVLVVGHQPTLGQVVAQLMTGQESLLGEPWSIKKGAVWWLKGRERDGAWQVTLHAVQSPDFL
jgi:phosphohistidine phosphatase